MKHILKHFACLFVAILCFGQVWADTPAAVGTTLFSENFGSYSANDVPSGTVTTATGRVVYGNANVTYACTNGDGTSPGTTKIYNENTGGGTAPEIMIGKYGSGGSTGGSFSITGIPSGGAKAITVSFTQNKQKLKVAVAGTGYTSAGVDAKPSAVGTVTFDITVGDGAASTFDLTFSVYSSNVRVDDILVTVKTAGEGGAPAKTLSSVAVSGTPTKTSYNTGDNFDPAGLTVTGTYSDASTAPITSGITWSYNPSQTLAKNQTSIGVTATVSNISSSEFNVTGLTVTDPVVSTWQVIAPSDLVTGDVVVLTMLKNSVYYAAPNNGGNNAPTATVVAVTNNKLSNAPAETLQWTVTVVEEGVYQFSVGSNYLKCTDTNNGVKVGTGDYNTFDINTTNEKQYLHTTESMTNAENGRYLGIYNTQDWRCYSSVNNNIKDGSLVIFKDASAAVVVAKPTISGDENFVTSATVTITQTNADAIYYTTNGDAPTASSAVYSAPFLLTNTATVKAIAVKGNDVSEVASKTFTKVTALTTMAEVQAEAGETEKGINVAISNWVVTAFSGSQVWFTDASNEKGILLYKSGHGFTAGKKLNGTVVGTKIKLYNLYPEMTSLVSTEVTVTNADAITPRTTTIAALTSRHPAEQGTIVKLEGLTYSSSSQTLSDGTNTIAADNKFYSSLALINETTYDITGVVTYYKDGDNAVVKIAPRSEADVEAQTPVVIPTAANLAALKAAERGTYILTLSDAVISYVNGSNAFIEEGTTGALIYFSNHGYKAGDCLNGDYQVTTADYKGKFEITAMEAQEGATKTTATVPLTTVTIATLNANFASYESRRVKIAGADVTDGISGSDRNGTINDGAALAVYASVQNAITLTADNNVDIIGYPGFNNSDQQLTVWAQADITVNGGETPTPEGDNVVILAQYGSKYYAMSTTNANNAFTAIAVEYDGSQITVNSAEDKAAIQWTKTTSDDNTTFQDASGKYMKSADGTTMSLQDAVCNWVWDATGEYYKINNTSRTFFYQNGVGFKNFAISNFNKSGYSDKAQVIAIAAENIVINSKVSAELAYNPASAEITEGDAWTAPELVNPHSVTITSYASDNESVATVTDAGVIALANGTGTAVITAHFAGDASYLEGEATYTITVNAAASPSTGTTYRKVTATADITDGEYLIVYEGDATHDAAVFDGSLDNVDQAMKVLPVAIVNDEIAGNTELDAAVFTIDVTAGSLQSASGLYIGREANSNGMDKSTTEAYVNTFAITDGEAVITGSAGPALRYNYASDQLRFRYYKSGQQAIQLYKKESARPEELVYTQVRDGLESGRHYTACLKKKIVAVKGATIWSLRYRNEAGTAAYLEEVTDLSQMAAGTPFIYQATADKFEVVYEGNDAEAPVESGALRGTFVDMTSSDLEALPNVYLMYQNTLRPIQVGNHNSLQKFRAYLLYDAMSVPSETPQDAPGRRVRSMPMQGNVATGIEDTESAAQAVKVMIDGQLFIQRGDKLYDVTGQMVK